MQTRGFKILFFLAADNGLEQTFTIPNGNRAIAIKADGNVYQATSALKGADNYWPVSQGCGESVIARGDDTEILYFTGDEGAILYIKHISGIGA